ncbi:MAG: AbrB/MazE/SpoVT family DNA-binding domain-containing protein [Wenzhouxiangella sp.]|nr:MAG: AbrB/MazE/SpoVT family DNA-binding domain-containing protein [Wenzhouxiangella sp.]
MKTQLVQIGNSRGIRIPKPLIEQAGLGDQVELRVEDGQVIIENHRKPRAGWAEAARELRQREEGPSLDETPPTLFDESEWDW